MFRYRMILVSALGLTFSALPSFAQKQEVTLLLGGVPSQSRDFRGAAGSAEISPSISMGANYGHRFLQTALAALYGEVEFVALPNRTLSAATALVPKSYASLYLTPGLRLKFLPGARLSPWVAVGGGYALYEQSAELVNGQQTTSKFLNRGVIDFGGGLDYRLWWIFGLRGEVRDFLSGNPNLNVAPSSSTQHNVIASGGVVVRF